MMKMRIVATLLCMLAAVALADTITQPHTFTNNGTNYAFDKFNPSLGTLDSITLTYDFDSGGAEYGIDNDGSVAMTSAMGIYGTLTRQGYVFAPGYLVDSGGVIDTTCSHSGTNFPVYLTSTANNGDSELKFDTDVAGADYASFFLPARSNIIDASGTQNPAGITKDIHWSVWPSYTGSGTFTMYYATTVGNTFPTADDLNSQHGVTASVSNIDKTNSYNVTLVYNYTPGEPGVPEPSVAFALMLLGSIGMFHRRARKA